MSNGKGEARWPLTSRRYWSGAGNDETLRTYLDKIISGQRMAYAPLQVAKRTGGVRVLHSPEPELMAVQRRLLDGLLARGVPHPSAYAYRTGLSTVDCASVHLKAHTVIRLDIADFFPSIRERDVFEALLGIDGLHGPSRAAAYEMARLLTVSPQPDEESENWINRGTGFRISKTGRLVERRHHYRHQREGFLPQGAPTSGLLSNLVMRDADQLIYELAAGLGLRFSRYSDDLYFSSRRPVWHHVVDDLIRRVRAILADRGFRLNDRKTYVARPGARRSVLGVLVDGPTPRLPREYKRKVDLHLRGVGAFGLAEHADHRGFDSEDELDAQVTGLLSYARMVEAVWGEPRWETWRRLREVPEVASAAPSESDWGDLFSGGTLPPEKTTGAAVAKASIDALVRGANRYRQSADYVKLLEFVGSFKRYSPFNAMLVDLQRPGTRYVLTAARWRDDYRRVLKPGAQSLLILQPGGPVMVVYDVGETEALPRAPALPREFVDPLAIRARVREKDLDVLWERTVRNAVRDGIRVTLVDNANHSGGQTYRSKTNGEVLTRPGPRGKGPDERYPLRHEIEVNRNLELLDRYATLVHELAHQYCGHLGTPNRDWWPDRRRAGAKDRNEIEAESIAYMVLARLDPSVEMGDYILGHLKSGAEMPSDLALDLMFTVAGEIIEMGQKRLPARQVKKR
ncbi:MAG: reverse transcriptase family protein [Pseudonocardiaceae bacterium]